MPDGTEALFVHDSILDGNLFSVTGQATKASTETYVLYLLTPAEADGLVHMALAVRGSAEANVKFYEAPTVSNSGTPVTPVCRRRYDAQAASTAVYHTPTTSDVGTLLAEAHFGSGVMAGGDSDGEQWVLSPQTGYLIVITSEAAGNDLSWRLILEEGQ